jgi:nicotinamidase-related amidase
MDATTSRRRKTCARPYDGAMPLIEREASVLVVVDTQPGFITDADPAAAAAVEQLLWLATIARLLEIPAVVTEEAPDREGATDPRVLATLDPATPVLPKDTFGLAGEPAVVEAIRATQRETAVLVGFETDVCVSQSAIGLQDLGYRVAVVADASYTQDARQHEAGLRRIGQLGIELVDAKGVAFEWMRTVDVAIATTRAAKAPGRTGSPQGLHSRPA